MSKEHLPGVIENEAFVQDVLPLKRDDENANFKEHLSSLYSNELLKTVQRGIISFFNNKPLERTELSDLQQNVRAVIKLNIGQFLCPFYEERILKKGMWILREQLRNCKGLNFLICLADVWNFFYKELLPKLLMLLCNVQAYKNNSIKQITLKAFRDQMLLKTDIRECISLLSEEETDDDSDDSVRTALQQMFLVLLGIQPSDTKEFLELERITSLMVNPLMTARGVFYDGIIPDTEVPNADAPQPLSKFSGEMRRNISAVDLVNHTTISYDSKTLTMTQCFAPPVALKHKRQRSQPSLFLKELFASPGSMTDPRIAPSRQYNQCRLSKARSQMQLDTQ